MPVRRRYTHVTAVRMSPEQRRLLEAAAQATGVRMADLLRTSAVAAARQVLARVAEESQ
jgi:uncharacterized protein (DUF1778 family)